MTNFNSNINILRYINAKDVDIQEFYHLTVKQLALISYNDYIQ